MMARKTKEGATATRNAILDSAAACFIDRGVSGTVLEDIAVRAGTTRGAVYWHFDGKDALYSALMLERAVLPLEMELRRVGACQSADPLNDLHEDVKALLTLVASQPGVRQVLEIAMLKVEYLDNMPASRRWRNFGMSAWLARSERHLALARATGATGGDIHEGEAAFAVWVMVDGVIRTWLQDPDGFNLVEQGSATINIYLAGLKMRSNGVPISSQSK